MLLAQFSQLRPAAMANSMGPRMPMYPPSGPGTGQLLFYGQPPTAMLPHQAGFSYQQRLVPRMRPGGAPMSNFFLPVAAQQGQQGQRLGGIGRGRMYRFQEDEAFLKVE
uniref:Uncharacterized protein n=1 Tax=Lactuca sativa TaxID=4236 RepID=A0A9R1USE2_LACSA|nr:hypothetical protein LSAT_V11C800445130 [Lactuca sativa]